MKLALVYVVAAISLYVTWPLLARDIDVLMRYWGF